MSDWKRTFFFKFGSTGVWTQGLTLICALMASATPPGYNTYRHGNGKQKVK
jgi:hypothetical protein